MTNPPDLTAIRAALFKQLNTYYTSNGNQMQVYRQASGLKIIPCIILEFPSSTDFNVTFGRGIDEYTMKVYAAVSPNELDSFDLLDSIVSGYGPMSLRSAVAADVTLGGLPLQANMPGWDDIGGSMPIGGNDTLAARGKIIVNASGVAT